MFTESFAVPKIVVSKCLGFDACRYNGVCLPNDTVERLKKFVEFVCVCPEVEVGLGVPRNPIRIVEKDSKSRLVQPATGLDITEKMNGFCAGFLDALSGVDGFILKSKSPSCGIKDTKIYTGAAHLTPVGRSAGFFGRAVKERFGHLAFEDEARLTNFRIREHFYTMVFALARLRQVARGGKMSALVDFHSDHKYMFMASNQAHLKKLGKVVANHGRESFDKVMANYDISPFFARIPTVGKNVNVLLHTFGYFSGELTSGEKAFFLETLENYRTAKAPLSVCCALIRSWIVRFDQKYLARQTFFNPFPAELADIKDSGTGR